METPLNTTLGVRMSAYLTTSEDFRKQRKRLNKRIAKLRHELDLVTRDTKQYKDKEKTSAISGADYDANTKFGLLLLLTAERDILYALEIKNVLEISNEKSAPYKNLMVSRIKKSLSTSKKLLEISANEASDITKIELYIYVALIQGQLAISKKQWALGLNSFSIARVALDFLYTGYSKEGEETEGEDKDSEESEAAQFSKTLINDLLTNVVDPSLSLVISQDDSIVYTSDVKSISRKYCHGDQVPYLKNAVSIISKHDPTLVSDLSSSVELIKSIEWRGHEAQIYNDEIAYTIMNLTSTSSLSENDYDVYTTRWTDVLELHQQDTEKNQDEDDLDKVQDRAILLTYINYNLLFTRLKRDLLIIEDLTSNFNKNIINFYDSVVSVAKELKELPGVYNDDELYQSIENLEKFLNAKKYLLVADLYNQNNKHSEALKIYSSFESELLTEEKFYKLDKFPYNVTSNEEFKKFQEHFSAELLKTRVLAQAAYESGRGGPVAENINKYPNDLRLVNLSQTLKLQPILSKPVLFDISYNYINYDLGTAKTTATPVVSQTQAQTQTEEDNKKKGGFFGIFGRN